MIDICKALLSHLLRSCVSGMEVWREDSLRDVQDAFVVSFADERHGRQSLDVAALLGVWVLSGILTDGVSQEDWIYRRFGTKEDY